MDFNDLTDDEDVLELINIVVQGQRRNPRVFRTRIDHFTKWSEEEFFARFRLSKRTAREVLNQINIGLPTKRSKALSPEDMLLLTLRYYATGSMLIVVGDFSGVHKSTASRVVRKVSAEIARLKNRYIKMPETENDIAQVCLDFYRKARFPKCIGALDCTHIRIQSPGHENGELFRNRKGYFSFNVQCIVDASLLIRNIVCRWPGSAHDSTIWNMSRIRARFERGEMGSNMLVADSGYAIKPYLITPLLNPITPAENLFNEAQIRTRNPVERTFGIWKRRFPILAQGIRIQVQCVDAIVVATAVLHNIACQNSDPTPPPLNDEIENFINDMDNFDVNPAVQQPIGQGQININNVTRLKLIEYFSRLV